MLLNQRKIWQADFYKRPYQDEQGQTLWELLMCDAQGSFVYRANCPQSQVNSSWLVSQIQQAAQRELPEIIQVFRPQSLSLFTVAAEELGINIEATRRTATLKKELQKQSFGQAYNLVNLEQPPPQALPDYLWGQQWQFAALSAGELIDAWRDRPIPILEMSQELFPINLGIASTVLVPGVIIYGGRNSMYLARWLEEVKPVALNSMPMEVNQSGGLVLEAGLVERWIIATFEDRDIAKAAQIYEQRKQASQGLHFLLVQPDDSGITYSGFWLLREE